MDGVKKLVCLAMLSGFAETLLPEGKLRSCARMIAGLIAVRLVCQMLWRAARAFE